MGLPTLRLREASKVLFNPGDGKGSSLSASSEAGLRRGLLSEETFTEMLCIERRRSERSRKPFLLLLLRLDARAQKGKAAPVLAKVTLAIGACTRETDFCGWYQTPSAIGVLFTELGEARRETLVEAIRSKVVGALHANLEKEVVERIQISFHIFPEEERGGKSGRPVDHRLYPDLSRKRDAKRFSLAVKRTMDIVGSACALILLAPVFLLIALAIKLTSKGPVLFKQGRVGQGGSSFTFLKFRTMYEGSDSKIHQEYVTNLIQGKEDAGQAERNGVYKITRDPRVTPVGQFLRRASLDELPQFFNVLKGEMSLVGPRPPIPYELKEYDIWHLRRVLEVKPGITGLWQVNGRSQVGFDEMVRLDLRYAEGWSLSGDLLILLKTPRAVLSCVGAY